MRLVYALFGVLGVGDGLIELFGSGDGHVAKAVFAILIGVVAFSGIAIVNELDRLGRRVDALERAAQPAEASASPGAASAGGNRTEDAVDDIEAKALLRIAQEHHFSKRFPEARRCYSDLVERFPDTKPAVVAWQQLDNLRNV